MQTVDGLAHAREPEPRSTWTLFDAIGSGVAVTLPDGTLEYCNSSLSRLIGERHDALLGSSIFTWLDGEAEQDLRNAQLTVLATRQELTAQVRCSNGRFRASVALRRHDSQGQPRVIWSLIAATRDEPTAELALWGTEIGLWDWDVVNDRLTWINDWCEHSQLAAFSGDGHEKLWSSRIHPQDLPAYRHAVNEHLLGRSAPYDVEYRLRNCDEVWVWIQERGRVIERAADGTATRMVGVCMDAEERHTSAHALERSESRLAHALWGPSVGLWEYEISKDTLHWWNDWCERVDLDPCSGPNHSQRWDARVHSDDLPEFSHRYQDLIEGRSDVYESEYRIRTRSGRWRWVMSRGRATARDAAGRAVCVAGVTFDNDERKRMELALRDSEARLEAAIWGADLGLWDWTLEDDSLLWLSDWPRRFGIHAESRTIRRDQWIGRVHPLDRDKYAAEDRALKLAACNSAESDYRVLSSSGHWRWVNVRTRVIERNSTGQALRIVGACIDVDSRRQAEQTLRTQARILETMREGVVLVALDGAIEFTNPAFDAMFRRSAQDPTGHSVLDLFNGRPTQSAPMTLEALLDLRNRRGRRDMLFRRRDGSQFAGEVLSAEVEMNGEKKILVVVQDVSERKKLESEIVEIANAERRRLGADLHDGLGQELTGISLMLRSHAKRAAVGAFQATPEINEIIALVNHAIQSARKMALGISPVTLERGGLLPALQTLMVWSRDSYHIDMRLHLAIRSSLTIGESASAHLYLIAQEAINNAVKHGQARSIMVRLRSNRSRVLLSVTDDGAGIAEPPARGTGMGLKLMEYRSAVIGGVMGVKRRPQGGTRIRCLCPQDAAARPSRQRQAQPVDG